VDREGLSPPNNEQMGSYKSILKVK